jgi:hypothetical protein
MERRRSAAERALGGEGGDVEAEDRQRGNSEQGQIFTCEPGFLDAPELAKDLLQVLLTGLIMEGSDNRES